MQLVVSALGGIRLLTSAQINVTTPPRSNGRTVALDWDRAAFGGVDHALIERCPYSTNFNVIFGRGGRAYSILSSHKNVRVGKIRSLFESVTGILLERGGAEVSDRSCE